MSVLHHYSGTELNQPTGGLVTDATSQSGQVWQVASAVDWGCTPPVNGGLVRLRIRLKRSSATGSLTVRTYSGLSSATEITDWDAIDETDLPEAGTWYEVLRTVRFGAPNYFFSLFGTWAGLKIDWIRWETLSEPVYVAAVTPDRIRYAIGQSGSVVARLVNTTGAEKRVTVRIRVESGLSAVRPGVTRNVTLAAPTSAERQAGTDEQSISLPLPALAQGGNTVVVEVVQNGAVISSAGKIVPCGDDPLRLSPLYWGWKYPDSFTTVNAEANFAAMDRLCAYVAEHYFQSACEATQIVPPVGYGRSGQSQERRAWDELETALATSRARGLANLAYTTRWGFGPWIWTHLARERPDLVESELGNADIRSLNLARLEEQLAAFQSDDPSLNPEALQGGMLPLALGNPEAVEFYLSVLIAALRFGFDGFRGDNGSPVVDEALDCRGRSLPFPGWNNVKAIRRIRDGLRAVRPDVLFGNNIGGNGEARSLPYPEDNYTALVERNGFAMQEGETNGADLVTRPFGTWAYEAGRSTQWGMNAVRFGGQQVNILAEVSKIGLAAHFFQCAMTLASSCHIAYAVDDSLRPLMQLAARHSDLYFGPDLRIPDDDPLTVSGAVLWQPFVRVQQISPTRRRYLVHLLNPPAGVIGSGNPAPDPVPNVALQWTLPPGWKATAAYALTPDGGYSLGTQTYSQTNRRVNLTLPTLYRYTLVVVEAQGKPLPTPRPEKRDARTAPRATLATASGVLGTGNTNAYHIRGNEPAVQPAVTFSPAPAGSSLYREGRKTYLRLGNNTLNLGFAPDIPRPGRYQLTVQLKSLVTPPGGASLYGQLQSANNNETPTAAPTDDSAQWLGADMPVGQWVERQLEANLTFPNYWCALLNGWDGLLIGDITLTRLRELTRAEVAATVTDSWPESQPVNTSSVLAYVGAGPYYIESGIVAALQARGLSPSFSKMIDFRGELGFDTPFPSSADVLAGHRVIALANLKAAHLTPQQHLWLENYVRAGGILVVSGGAFGFANGGYGANPLLADLLPVTVQQSYGDFQPLNGTLAPVSALAQSVSWSAPPTVPWGHTLTPKAGATVHLTVGNQPVAVRSVLGSGRVLALGIAPYGVAGDPYWNWDQWTALLGKLVMGS